MSVISIIFAVWATIVAVATCVIPFVIGLSAYGSLYDHRMRQGEAREFVFVIFACIVLMVTYGFGAVIIWKWAL